MKEVKLILSDEDFNIIERELLLNGTTEKLCLNIVEAWIRESPQVELQKIRGELV